MENRIALYALDSVIDTLKRLPVIDDSTRRDTVDAAERLRAAVLEGEFTPDIDGIVLLRGWNVLCEHYMTGEFEAVDAVRYLLRDNLINLREIKGRQVERMSGRPRRYVEMLLAVVDVLEAAESDLYAMKLCNERMN